MMAKSARRQAAQRRTAMAAVQASGGMSASMLTGSGRAHRGASYSDQAMAGWDPLIGSADADLLPDLGRLTARSRDLARNNGLMSGANQTMRDNIVGSTLRLSTNPDYRLLNWTRQKALKWGNTVEAHFRSWAETTECDAGNSLNLMGLTMLALSGSMGNGDHVALPVFKARPGCKWKTRIMSIEADRLCTPPWLEHREDVRGGIKFDKDGAPLSYFIRKHHPGDVLTTSAVDYNAWDEVPAATSWGRKMVLHLHDKERTGQSRGKPIVSAVMAEFKMAGDYASNELQASVANSLVAAFVQSNLSPDVLADMFGVGREASLPGKPNASSMDVWEDNLRRFRRGNTRINGGGAMVHLPPGTSVEGFSPNRPNAAFEAFMLASLRHIAAGLNMPYELLVKDFSRTNYSSIRAALLEAWRYFNGRRRWLMDYWLRPIYQLWFEEAVDQGLVSAPGFYDNVYAYTRCRFIFGGRGWVDPVKEAQASKARMEAGISTLEQECAEQGLDYEEVLDQLEIEAKMRAARGLPPLGAIASPATAPATPATGSSKTERDEEELEDDLEDDDERQAA